MVSVLVGALVAVLFILGFIINGSVGESMAIVGKEIMYKAITVAAIGSVVGMLAFYVEGTHELQMDSNKEANEDDIEGTTVESSTDTVKM